jgi:hypothetical protein
MKNIPAAIAVAVVFFSTINFAIAQTAKPGGREPMSSVTQRD